MKTYLPYLLFLLVLAACTNKQKPNEDKEHKDSIVVEADSIAMPGDTLSLTAHSQQLLQLLKKKDYAALQSHIHPEKGIRFSPYGFINIETDVHIQAHELPGLISKIEKTLWGSYDGTGEDIQLTFNKYAEKFIYDVNFLNPEKLSLNQSLSSGNTLNNLTEVYPNAEYTESYFSGFEKKYQGMDWKALRLVYEKYKGKNYLVGIVHDQWTI